MSVPQVLITARNFYVSKGIPMGGAIALPSVLYYESKLNPGSQGRQPSEAQGKPRQVLNPYGAYGIASWNGDRQGDLADYATAHHLDVGALETQLAFVLNEIANSYPGSWAAIRSQASYKAIITILVNEYEDPLDKPKEIEGAIAIAAPLAALPPPSAAPEAHPQVPAPHVPIPAGPLSAPSSGLPPISATSAGRRAAEQAYVAAMLEQLTLERAAIDEEIADFQGMAETLAKRNPTPTAQIALQPPAADSADQPTRSQTMFAITNWATTLSGIATILTALGAGLHAVSTGDLASAYTAIPAIIAGIGLVKAKDNNVTGGTIPATPEAAKRIAVK